MLLTQRRLLVNKLIDVEAEIRGTLRGFGLKIGRVGRAGFAVRVRELLDRAGLIERPRPAPAGQ